MKVMHLSIHSVRPCLSALARVALAAPLALSLAACDGVDDQDAPAVEELALDDEDPAEADDALAIAGDDDEYDDEDADGGLAPAPGLGDLEDKQRETKLCWWYSQKAVANLNSYSSGTLGNVELQTNCNDAYARVNITNSSTAYFQNGIKVALEYWNSATGTWVSWGAKHDYTSQRSSSSTATTSFATGTYVRACGFIESASPLDYTPYTCTPYFAISSSS